MARTAKVNEPVVVSQVLYDGDESKYLRAYIYDNTGVFVGHINLLHRAFGFYHQTFTPSGEGQFTIVTITYNDAGYTEECLDYNREGDVLFVSHHAEIDSSELATAVWDEVLPGNHDSADTSGLLLQVVNETTQNTNDIIIGHPTHSLEKINENVLNQSSLILTEIDANEVKIDQILANTNTYYNQLDSSLTSINTTISNMNTDMISHKNEVISYVTINTDKLDVVLSQLSQLQNQTRFIAIVPPTMSTPETGSKTYQFYLAIYDQNGSPEAPDITPSVTITNSDGTILVDDIDLTQDGYKVGQYYFEYSINESTPNTILRIVFKVTEDGVVSYVPRSSEITVYDNDMAQILNRVEYYGTVTEQNRTLLTGVEGLTVLKNEIQINRTDIAGVKSDLNPIKLKTDLIIADPATSGQISSLDSKVDTLPLLVDITSVVEHQTDLIRGASNKDLTDVFDNEKGTNNALLANDPRLSFLDAAISTRSDITVSDIWTYGTRELTSAAPLDQVEIAKIWDYLVTNIATAGSIGKLLTSMLDEPNSVRGLTSSEASLLVAPLALEATSNSIIALVSQEANENQTILNHISDLVDLIKPKTDLIVSGGATEANLNSHDTGVQATLLGLSQLLTDINNKTTNLPADPAKESSVNQIPRNPLLEDDSRLLLLGNLIKLDEPISSRVAITDLPNDYATSSQITDLETDMFTYRNDLVSLLSQKPDSSFFDTHFTEVHASQLVLDEIKGAGFTSDDSLHMIKTYLNSMSGAVLTAQQVWEYTTRELTQSFNYATVQDIEDQTDILSSDLTTYSCNMTTTFNTNLDQQVVLCWLDINGQTQENTVLADIALYDEAGNLTWSQTGSTTIRPGVFKFTQANISSLIGSADRNYIIKIAIESDGGSIYRSVKPFFTVG